MLFEKKCCNIGYTVLPLLYILLNDALKSYLLLIESFEIIILTL